MNIDHVAIYVNNLEVEKDFYVKYFGAHASEKYTNFRNDFSSYFLVFDNGSREYPGTSGDRSILTQKGRFSNLTANFQLNYRF